MVGDVDWIAGCTMLVMKRHWGLFVTRLPLPVAFASLPYLNSPEAGPVGCSLEA